MSLDPVAPADPPQATGGADTAPSLPRLSSPTLVEPPPARAQAPSTAHTNHRASDALPSASDASANAEGKSVEAFLEVARMAHQRGLPALTEKYYFKAVKAYPKSAVAWNDLGQFYLSQEQYTKAAQAYRMASRLKPDSIRYHNNLGNALVRAGRLDDGIEEFGRAVGPAAAHYNAAVVLHEIGENAQSVTHLHSALAKNPQLKEARSALELLDPAAAARLAKSASAANAKPRRKAATRVASASRKPPTTSRNEVRRGAGKQRQPLFRWPRLTRDRAKTTPKKTTAATKAPKPQSRSRIREFFERLRPDRSKRHGDTIKQAKAQAVRKKSGSAATISGATLLPTSKSKG